MELSHLVDKLNESNKITLEINGIVVFTNKPKSYFVDNYNQFLEAEYVFVSESSGKVYLSGKY